MRKRTTIGTAVAATALAGAVLFPATANAAPATAIPAPAASTAPVAPSAPVTEAFHAEATGVDWFGRISVETRGYTGPVWMTDASGQDVGFGIVYADGTTVLSDPLWTVPDQITVSTDDGTSVVLDVPRR